MKKNLLIVLLGLTLAFPALLAAATTLDLMPVPEKVTWAEGRYDLDATFTATVTGQANPRLYSATTRMLRRLSGRTGLFLAQAVVTPAGQPTNPRRG